MEIASIAINSPYDESGRIDFNKLGRALRYCHDLPLLQNSDLTHLPSVENRARGDRRGLDLARALRKELITCTEQIARHTGYPSIREIVEAIEREKLFADKQLVAEVSKRLVIPFSRDRRDLARYYGIRLRMEGLANSTIAEFLQVELRTLGNYIAEAKERIRLILESR